MNARLYPTDSDSETCMCKRAPTKLNFSPLARRCSAVADGGMFAGSSCAASSSIHALS